MPQLVLAEQLGPGVADVGDRRARRAFGRMRGGQAAGSRRV
jgi:hypothetical protein